MAAGIALVVVIRAHSYRGPSVEPVSRNGVVQRARVVEEARRLVGVFYDPLQGYGGNIGGRLGFIVCMDVPVIAYRNAGASLKGLLEADYRVHAGSYDPHAGKPGDPYFHRRARNLYAYCKANGRLDLHRPPRLGDVVFLSRTAGGPISHIALVSGVRTDGHYDVVEASRDYFYKTHEVGDEDLTRRGWLFRGFGDVLDPAPPP